MSVASLLLQESSCRRRAPREGMAKCHSGWGSQDQSFTYSEMLERNLAGRNLAVLFAFFEVFLRRFKQR